MDPRRKYLFLQDWLDEHVKGTPLDTGNVPVSLCFSDGESIYNEDCVELPEESWDLLYKSATDPERVEFARQYPSNFTIVEVPNALLDAGIITITWDKHEDLEDVVDINQTAFKLYKENLALKEELRILKERSNL